MRSCGMRIWGFRRSLVLLVKKNRSAENKISEPRPFEWTLSWAPSWELSAPFVEGAHVQVAVASLILTTQPHQLRTCNASENPELAPKMLCSHSSVEKLDSNFQLGG